MSKPERDKQKEVTAATLKRIAKECRKEARLYPRAVPRSQDWRKLGQIFDAEAKLLRSMR